MIGSLRQSMAWLHTWSGLLVTWLLYLIFLTGTASYFKQEISAWTRPEAPVTADANAGLARAYDYLSSEAAGADYWLVSAPSARNPTMQAYWSGPDGEYHDAVLDPRTGAPDALRSTLGGEFFYRFHFELQLPYPWGRWLACIAAMMGLVAIISGVITHKRIFKDFFVFRRTGGAQRTWLDAHNVSSVLILPFHIMITFTGLVTLLIMVMPWGVAANYGAGSDQYFRDRFGDSYSVEASGRPAPLAHIAPMLGTAAERFNAPVGTMLVERPGDANARVELIRADSGRIAMRPPAIIFSGVTGEVQSVRDETRPAALTEDVLYGLHMGRFGGVALRWLYFLCGVGGAAMIATGAVLWVKKRRPKWEGATFGGWLVQSLNIGAIFGAPLAMAAFFWANRLLPLELEARGEWEARAFLITLGVALLYACLRPARRGWVELSALAAASFIGLPILNACTTERGLPASLLNGDLIFAGVDCAFLLIGAGLAFAAWRNGAHQKVAP